MSGLEKNIYRYLYNLKQEGYDSDDAEEALLIKIKSIVKRTKYKKSIHHESDHCEECHVWVDDESDRTLYDISSLQHMGMGHVKVLGEILCDKCVKNDGVKLI